MISKILFGISFQLIYRTTQISHILAMTNRTPKVEPPRLSDYMQFFNQQAESIADYGLSYYLAKI
ncbi:DUF4035 domain-containing protein [Ursidibacter maritimus]|nr:DUF4035 domain-containing protein [Ursidibacter maritimus]